MNQRAKKLMKLEFSYTYRPQMSWHHSDTCFWKIKRMVNRTSDVNRCHIIYGVLCLHLMAAVVNILGEATKRIYH